MNNDPLERRCTPGFTELLSPFSLRTLEASPDVAYAIDNQYRLVYFNPAWQRFALSNGGEPAISREWGLGRNIMDAVPPVLQPFYHSAFDLLLTPPDTRKRPPFQKDYECSGATTYRRFVMTVYPLTGTLGLLIVNARTVEKPHDDALRPHHAANTETYIDNHGILHQCAHCRRVRNLNTAERWDWVPEWVAHTPAEASHTLCDFCFAHYYGGPEESEDS